MSTDIKEIKMDITNIKMDIQRMCGIISKLKESQDITLPLSKCTVASQAVVALHSIFPLKTKEQLHQLENELEIVEKETQLSAFFDTIGGLDPNETVKRSLIKTFSNKPATEFSWQGRKEKYKLCNLKIMDIMYRSLLARCINMDEKKFQFRVQEWFRQAAARYRNEIQKDTENAIILELQCGNVDVAEIANCMQLNPTASDNEEQVN
ncbi:uncharacterized protein LOC114936639 [Nylanderia fulva]|nr:uncharacterized protein LOC114936639 [Nylanderia fulva]